jgi:murein DD-endopeptidase MepM/ murein hydrolase activator NlpD
VELEQRATVAERLLQDARGIRVRHWLARRSGALRRRQAAASARVAARAALDGRASPAPALANTTAPARRHIQLPLGRILSHVLVAALALVAAVTPAALGLPATANGAAVVRLADPSVPVALTSPAPALDLVGDPLAIPHTQPVALGDLDAYAAYHTLEEGETLAVVARRYAVSVAALFWANGLDAGGALAAGQELRIPRISGVPYVVQPDDTLAAIAERFSIPVEAITLFQPNQVQQNGDLPVGQELFLPGASLAYPQELLDRLGGAQGVANLRALAIGEVQQDETNLREGPGRAYLRAASLTAGAQLVPLARHEDWVKVDAGELGLGWVRSDLIALPQTSFLALPETSDFPPPPPRWVWPTYGRLTSPFGWRTVPFRSFHDGLDIANRAGTGIVAARSGVVAEAGWCSGFGYCVKIDHGGGVRTIYGHMLKKPPVRAGDAVAAGDLIGLMGSTYDRAGGGYSTGVHLHFTIKVDGKAVNPLKFLP